MGGGLTYPNTTSTKPESLSDTDSPSGFMIAVRRVFDLARIGCLFERLGPLPVDFTVTTTKRTEGVTGQLPVAMSVHCPLSDLKRGLMLTPD